CSPLKAPVERDSALLTTAMYSRVRAKGLSNRTPCQPSDTCGPDTPRPKRKRPSVNTSRLAAVIAVIAGVRGGVCTTAEPTSIVEVGPASQARRVGLSEP